MAEEKTGQGELFPDNPDKGAQNRLALFEDCAAAIDQLFQQALETTGPTAFDEFLARMCRFSNLSAYNAMLVTVQRPGALAVASRNQWQSIARTVKADALPIAVLQPFGPVRFVFEYSDTEGYDPPEAQLSALFAEGSIPPDQYDRTKSVAKKYGVLVEETDKYGPLLAGTAAGINMLPTRLNASQREGPRYHVRLNSKHDLPTRYSTLAHELGHVYCGHLGADCKGRWPDRSALVHSVKELEAEAVAWLVCQRTGVSARSREYLSRLARPDDIMAVSAYAIFEAANRIESRTSPHT